MDKAVDVSAYFYGVKEDVSTDYRDLALFLGITDTRNIESRNTDATSCCLDVLQTWKRTKGHQATVEVLLQALTSAKLESAADNLRMNLGKGDYPTPPPDQINITLSETPENETHLQLYEHIRFQHTQPKKQIQRCECCIHVVSYTRTIHPRWFRLAAKIQAAQRFSENEKQQMANNLHHIQQIRWRPGKGGPSELVFTDARQTLSRTDSPEVITALKVWGFV
ncbi:hypothetical protein Bbelb_235640 [Branchiostoma belcheri]|nr:hypothetical protein Bbelb_235640 [Branchiostoma belcheri]